MNGEFLRFYLPERLQVQHRPAWEWLLYQARDLGIQGGSAFRAIGGFGSHRVMHEYKFFELADMQAIEVEFIVTAEEAEALLRAVEEAQLRVFHARIPASFGVTGAGPASDR
jgi:PII-like signaling protein